MHPQSAANFWLVSSFRHDETLVFSSLCGSFRLFRGACTAAIFLGRCALLQIAEGLYRTDWGWSIFTHFGVKEYRADETGIEPV